MQTAPSVQIAGLSAAQLLFRTIWVFAAAVASIVVLDGGFGILIGGGIVYYFLARQEKKFPRVPTDPAASQEFAGFRFHRGIATFLAFLAVSLMPIMAWILWAFPGVAGPMGPEGSEWLTVNGVISVMAGMLLASALFFWLAVASLRQPDEDVGQAYRRALTGRKWAAFRPVATNLTMCFGIMGLVSVFSSLPGMIKLFEPITRQSPFPNSVEMAMAMPAAPVWLYASILLLALFNRLNFEDHTEIVPEDGSPIPHRSRPVPACAAVAVSAAVMLGALGNVTHLAVFGVSGPVSEVGPITSVAVTLQDWVDEQHESGRPSHEIVAELRHFGRWSPSSPDHGLAALMPSLKTGKWFERIDSSVCSFSIEAGIAETDDLRDVDWLPEDEVARPVKYCLTVECPSPTRWPEDATTSFSSSHSSQNRYWMVNTYLDIFAWGAAEPGGYCTTTGAVSDSFQG